MYEGKAGGIYGRKMELRIEEEKYTALLEGRDNKFSLKIIPKSNIIIPEGIDLKTYLRRKVKRIVNELTEKKLKLG